VKTDLEKYEKLDLPYVLIKGLFNKLENVDISKVYADRCKAELSQSKVSLEVKDKYDYKAVDNRNRQIKLHYLNQFFTEEKEKANEIYDGKILE
jgi:hypothetical protein